jgi:hypothetical protein
MHKLKATTTSVTKLEKVSTPEYKHTYVLLRLLLA